MPLPWQLVLLYLWKICSSVIFLPTSALFGVNAFELPDSIGSGTFSLFIMMVYHEF
jgi:hypothetical protein